MQVQQSQVRARRTYPPQHAPLRRAAGTAVAHARRHRTHRRPGPDRHSRARSRSPPGDADTDRSSVCRIADGESGLIRKALAATGGNLTQAARELDIAKSTLYLKLRRYGLEAEVHKVRRSGQPAL